MPDESTEEPTASGGVFSGYGIASVVLGVLSVAAIALAAVIWTSHRNETEQRSYQTRVMQTAVQWTSVLVNMNKDTVDSSLQKLHDGTVGQLNADFDSAVEPYRQVVQRLQSSTTGQIDAVALESLHHTAPANATPTPQPGPQPELAGSASRTDTVLVVATSVSQNVGDNKPKTVHWNLRLDVSDVDGKLLISRLEPIR
ncbi:MAG: hypothetical protein JWR37_2063 [Mycobacterium sp.]|jgi:hypothetical protein|nr:hypothetical protein [Mycobacterium sp.]